MTETDEPSAFHATSAWIPLLLSGTAVALLVGYLATGPHAPNIVIENGVARQDESAAARLWQLLMVLQLPAIGWFVLRWLPRDPKRTTAMLVLQAVAIIAAAMPVFILESSGRIG